MRLFILILFLPQLLLASPSTFQHEKFEWGAGALTFKAHHYRGSDQSKDWFIPLPYFIYTSETIEAEPSFVRGTFYRNDWFAFKLSINAGLSVESEKNRAREGMPSLDYTFEAGPMFIFKMWKSEDKKLILNFEWPIRQVHSTDLTYINAEGIFSIPYLNIIHMPMKSTWNLGGELSFGVMYGSKDYHQYFYGIESQYVTTSRPLYEAKSGYSGVQTTWILNKRIGDVVIMPFLRWDYLDGVAFKNSPLFKKKSYLLGGLGTFWLFGGK